ncbi:MAG TPA: nitroreductase [Firmicutes bacterium]|jgi:nitroreductase|nr:nitroreductase [Bacillota bacterium]
METRECLEQRRSVRNFKDQEIPGEILSILLEAVRWSPSWANTQCWELVIVKEKTNKEKLAELLAERNPATKALLQAPLVLVFCGKKGISGYKKGTPMTRKGDWLMFDVGVACQNFCLAAYDQGLGTVIVGNYDHQGVDELLHLPDGVESVAIVPLGYPVKESTPPPRKDISDFVFLENHDHKLAIN